jgi:hypothetical protein
VRSVFTLSSPICLGRPLGLLPLSLPLFPLSPNNGNKLLKVLTRCKSTLPTKRVVTPFLTFLCYDCILIEYFFFVDQESSRIIILIF